MNQPLINKTKNLTIADRVIEANSFYQRSRGLLGRKMLPHSETLWLLRCNSIHTWFMQFPIDAIFVDRNLIVRSVFKNIKPWRLILPVWGASSVFELAAGQITETTAEPGDQLHVGT